MKLLYLLAGAARFVLGLGIVVVGAIFFLSKSKNNGKTVNQNGNMMSDPRLTDARTRFNDEIKAMRNQDREQKRRFNRIDGAWRLASVGSGLLAGGLALEVTQSPIGPIGLGILIAAIVGWIGAIINNYVTSKAKETPYVPVPARPQIGAPIVASSDIPEGRTQLVQQVLRDAAAALQKLDNVVPKLRHPESISSVGQIVTVGNRVMNQVALNPEKFNIAQRVFTYYCPESVAVAEALAKLENEQALDIARIQSTQNILQKLSILFERTELELKADDNKALDIDLKLLDQSLQADLSLVKS
ncbi:MAG: Uncharacterized protein FD163_1962 [Hyphomonadaceae bacterium]|nr:MAG: Uncharacterized protein FD128_2196 [Hyphomonadaceae bacterium]KAF0184388.1 MAG: Uncharacterized protein FD163_1962 [Hyphomonadaceae bacterium]